jgi:hypothetical protein
MRSERGTEALTHFSFEPFPKSADLFGKRAVPYPPLSKESPVPPRRGFRLSWVVICPPIDASARGGSHRYRPVN